MTDAEKRIMALSYMSLNTVIENTTPSGNNEKFLEEYKKMFINTGVPYVYGGGHGETPWQSGTDCSGAPINAMNASGYNIPLWLNTDSLISGGYVKAIANSERRAGDLIFFKDDAGKYPHMAVDAGSGYVYNAWMSPNNHQRLTYNEVLDVHNQYGQSPFFYRWNWEKLNKLRK